MFTPSLMAMMLHSMWSDLPSGRPLQLHRSPGEIADDLQNMVYQYRDTRKPVPSVPVTGYSRLPGELAKAATVAPPSDAPNARPPAVFGRVPLDILARQFVNNSQLDARDEYLDVGTPLTASHSNALANQAVAQCKRFLGARAAGSQARMLVAVIDRGEDAPSYVVPDDFYQRAHHLYPTGVDYSQHAAEVIQTLVERLNYHGLTSEVDFIFGLIKKPASWIGRACFQHDNMVELHDAVSRLATYVSNSSVPLVCNISMGTHVGHHLGDTPLEVEVAQRLRFADSRVIVCAGGNDGLSSISASLDLVAGVEEHLRLQSTPMGCTEFLVELWWEDTFGHNSVDVSVNVRDLLGVRVAAPIHINTRLSGATLQKAGPGFRGVFCQSLYHSKCQGDSSCIAIALSSSDPTDLANLMIDITIEASQSTQLHSWIVLPGGSHFSFVGTRPTTNIAVPATFEDALATAGMNGRQPWRESSRGDPGRPGKPSIAHLAGSVGSSQMGTSFSAPRLTADVIERFLRSAATTRSPLAVASFPSIDSLTSAVLAKHGSPHALWNVRTGYGSIVGGP